MRWPELGFAVVVAVVFVLFHFGIPADLENIRQIRILSGIVLVVSAALYLHLVDDERRPKVNSLHRMIVGCVTGLLVALIAQGSFELYALLGLVGLMLGYIGFRWLKHL